MIPENGGGVRVKICGLTRPRDARAAERAGADFLGVVLSAGFGRSVPPEVARTLRAADGARLVGVLVDEEPARAAVLARGAGVDVLQLHGDEAPGTLAELREAGPWSLWKAVRPRTGGEILEAAERYAGVADALLVDGWHPEHRGGSGVRFPWAALEEVRDRLPADLEVVAAGGLTPANVAEAVTRLSPHVVDVSSGVEARPGQKDPEKVEAFVAAARSAARTERRDPDEGRT